MSENGTIMFRVYDTPRPGGSKRAFTPKGWTRPIIVDACKKNMAWRDSVKVAAVEKLGERFEPLTGALSLQVTFIMPRSKGHYGSGKNAGQLKATAPVFHTSRPDATKLLRSTEDALTGLAWRDDAQIAEQQVSKIYGTQPGAIITIRPLHHLTTQGESLNEPIQVPRSAMPDLWGSYQGSANEAESHTHQAIAPVHRPGL